MLSNKLALSTTLLGRLSGGRRGRWWRVGLALVLIAVLAYQLHEFGMTGGWSRLFGRLTHPHALGWLALAAGLMPVNWLLETLKWRVLLRPFSRWSWRHTLMAVLAGIAVSILTPNRIGEFGGRVLLAPPEQTGVVVLTSLLGSASQWAAFLLLGWPALVFCSAALWHWPPVVILALLPLGILVLSVLTVLVRRLAFRRLPGLSWRWRRRAGRLDGALAEVKFGLIRTAAMYAVLRFSVYCMQFYGLLLAFGLQIDAFTGLAGAAAIFTLQAGLPLPPGIGLLTRAELGVLLWGHTPQAGGAVVAATLALFVINLVIPALGGAFIIMSINGSQRVENEDQAT